MAGEANGQIIAPGENGATVNLTPNMWEGLVTLFREHGDYLRSGTEGQKELYQQFEKSGIVVSGSRQQTQSGR